MAIESNIYALWMAKQSAKGVLPNTANKRLIQVGGDLESVRSDSAEAFSDLEQFGNMTDYANTFIGQGAPQVEAQADVMGLMLFLFFGSDSVTTAAVVGEQTFTLGANAALATGGNFTITIGTGQTANTTANIVATAAGSTAANIKAALELLPVVKQYGSGGGTTNVVTVTGGPLMGAGAANVIIKIGNSALNNDPMEVTLIGVTSSGAAVGAPTVTVSKAATNATHKMVPAITTPLYATFWKRIGGATNNILRQKSGDSRFASLSIEGSTANKVVKITPSIMSIQPGITFSAAEETTLQTVPTFVGPYVPGEFTEENGKQYECITATTESPTAKPAAWAERPWRRTTGINLTAVPFMYTEGAGTFSIEGLIFKGHTQFNITWDYGLNPVYGDAVIPFDLVPGLAKISIAATIVMDETALEAYNRIIYGVAKPTANTKPLERLPAMGAYSFTLKKTPPGVTGATGTYEELNVSIPSVHWSPTLNVPINPQGGVIDLPLAGEARRNQGAQMSTVLLTNQDTAQYV